MTTTHDADAEARGKRALLRHGVATLAYRAAKALRNADASFATLRASGKSRSPLELVAHLAGAAHLLQEVGAADRAGGGP